MIFLILFQSSQPQRWLSAANRNETEFFVEMADYVGLKAVIPPVITGLYTRIPDVEFSPLLIRTKAHINVQVHLGANSDYTHPYQLKQLDIAHSRSVEKFCLQWSFGISRSCSRVREGGSVRLTLQLLQLYSRCSEQGKTRFTGQFTVLLSLTVKNFR